MRTVFCVLIIQTLVLATSCISQVVEKEGGIINSYVVPGIKGIGFRDVVRIRFENEGKIDTIRVVYNSAKLNKGDSILFSLNIKNPSKPKLKKVTYRTNNKEVFIPLNASKEKLYQYHALDKKPLFGGVSDFRENDSLISQYLKKELLKIQGSDSGPVRLYLVIDEQGQASVETVIMLDDITENNLKNIVSRMPLFEPGEHKGKKVKVSYLVEIR